MLIKRFEDRVDINPFKIAIKTVNEEITYRQLDNYANRAAGVLRNLIAGAGNSNIVGLLFEDTVPMISALLGTVKRGNAYLPLSIDYPEQRLIDIAVHSQTKIILTDNAGRPLADKLAVRAGTGITVQTIDPHGGRGEPCVRPDIADNNPGDNRLLYLLYTSGSTGTPKGVMQTAANVEYFIDRYTEDLSITPDDRITLLSSFSHDAAVMDIYGALLNGATLFPMDIKKVPDFAYISRWLRDEGITVYHSVPTVYRCVLNTLKPLKDGADASFPHMRYIVLGGEAVRRRDIDLFRERLCAANPDITLYNLYGMTESSYNSGQFINAKTEVEHITIGQPVRGTRIFLVDNDGSEVDVLETGEIVVASPAVSSGYWQDEILTGQAFRQHPELGRMYRTGDLGRLLMDGSIEFAGRKDLQVKIRGFRVELGEVESRLLTHDAVKEAVVTARTVENRKEDGDTLLCAYIVCNPGQEPAGEDKTALDEPLKTHVAALLPDYMVPALFVYLDELSLTASGKVNRAALPEPQTAAHRFTAPRSAMEKQLAAIWQDVLAVPEPGPGIDDNFFSLGGHSLKAITIAARVREDMDIKLPLQQLFKTPTIRGLALYLKENEDSEPDYPVVTPDRENLHEPFPITDIQMTYLLGRSAQFEIGGVATHGYRDFVAVVDMERLEHSLNRVIQRHPMLRAVVFEDGEQRILEDDLYYRIEVEDLGGLTADRQDKRIRRERKERSHHVFKTDEWPLFRIKAFKLAEPDDAAGGLPAYRLCVSEDRIITDNFSSRILQSEIAAYYEDPDLELPPLEFTFRDYMLAYKELENSPTYRKDREYWLKQLDDFPSAPQLPLACDPAQVKKPKFRRLTRHFDRSEWQRLQDCARDLQITPSVMFCTAFAETLAYWSNQPRLALNLTLYNRFPFHPDVNRVVGDFTSLMMLAVDLKPGSSFKERALCLQNTLFEAMEHRHYDGVRFIRELGRQNNVANKAIMPVVFTSLLFDPNRENEEPQPAPEPVSDDGKQLARDTFFSSQTSQVFIDNVITDAGGDLRISWNYVEDLFERETIETMFHQYILRLTGLMEKESENAAAVFQLPEQDKQLIDDYNRTAQDIPPATLQQLFADQVKKTPHHAALIHHDRVLTYRELERRSNRVARYLHEQGFGPGNQVGVLSQRGIETIINMLGIVKSGAAYVPVDPEYPQDRKNYILQNSSCSMFVEPDLYDKANLDRFPADEIENLNRPEDLAYIIYTSGSTGRPKGVVITHRAVTNTLVDINRRFSVAPFDRVLGISSMCFDLSVYDVFGTLAAGAACVVIEDQRDIDGLVRVLSRQHITFWNSVPSILDLVVNRMGGTPAAGTALPAPQETENTLYWSPVQLWKQNGTAIRIGEKEYGGAATQVFPRLYFLTRKGIEPGTLRRQFPDVDALQLDELIERLQKDRILVPSILSPQEIFKNGGQPETLRQQAGAFKQDAVISFRHLCSLLELFKQDRSSGTVRYNYASAGGLYPIDIYIYVKEDRVEDLEEGLYYYNPMQHTLQPLGDEDEYTAIGENAYSPHDKELFRSSALSIYMVYDADVTMPKYGGLGYFMAAIDAGIMANTLAQWAGYLGIALRPAAQVDYEKIRPCFHLEKTHVFIHSLEIGIDAKPAVSTKAPADISAPPAPAPALAPSLSWSPQSHWTVEGNTLRVDDTDYPIVPAHIFPDFYFLAQEGVRQETLAQRFADAVEPDVLETFIADLLQKRVLLDTPLTWRERFSAQDRLFRNRYSKAILYVPEEYEKFKTMQLNRMERQDTFHGSRSPVTLENGGKLPAYIRQRHTYRQFDETRQMPRDIPGKLLAAAIPYLEGIDLYLHVKKDRVEDLEQGLYLYRPATRSLERAGAAGETGIAADAHFPGNRSIFQSSALSIFMIGNNDHSFSVGLRCGEAVAEWTALCEQAGIGLCSIGSLDTRKLRRALDLDRSQHFLHAVELGLKPTDTASQAVQTAPGVAEMYSLEAGEQAGQQESVLNESVRIVMLSGDWIPLALPRKVWDLFKNAKVYSFGGATEGSIWSIYYPVTEVKKEWKSIPYGYPMANQAFWVLNYESSPCPVNVPGELYIGGTGVASGYMNDEEKTRKSFITHPELGYIYRTGDHGVLRRQGYIEFLGRKDSQVKIGGYRVELGEIETCLENHPAIKTAKVIDRVDASNKKTLIAYIVPEPEKNVPSVDLRRFLAGKLPPYMIPAYFVYLDEIPLNANGKVDRKALPEPGSRGAAEIEHQEPGTDVEKTIAAVCREMFDLERISIHDNFFDLGATSIDILKLRNRLKEIYSVDIPIIKVFEYSTINSFSRYLDRLISANGSSATRAEQPDSPAAASRPDRGRTVDHAKDRMRSRIRKRSETHR
jgi:amino acid adenylation domain-containing protein